MAADWSNIYDYNIHFRMRVYQVHLLKADNGSRGYSYHVNKREAKQAAKGNDGWRGEINVEISKPGIIMALNTYAGNPDNG